MDSISAMDLWSAVCNFFASPAPICGMAAARVCLGFLLLVDAIPYVLDRHAWLSGGGALPSKGFWWRRPGLVNIFLGLHVLGSLVTLLGSSLLILRLLPFFTIYVLHRRTAVITYGGDSLLRVAIPLLAFSPAHAALSIERYVSHGDLGLDVHAAPWGARLLQIELSILYIYNCWHKLNYRAWRDGSAVWFCLRNPEVARRPPSMWPLPDAWLKSMVFSKLGTWSTLLIEGLLGFGLWITELRPPLLVAAVVFHLLLTYFLEIWLFSFIVVASLLVFLPTSLFPVASTAPLPFGPTGEWGIFAAVMLAVSYVLLLVFSDPPYKSELVDNAHAWMRRVLVFTGLSRGWKLFTGDPPAARTCTIRILVTAAGGGTGRWMWSPRRGLQAEGVCRHYEWGVRHRIQKLSNTFSRGPDPDSVDHADAKNYTELCEVFGRYILAECRSLGISVKLLSIDCELLCLSDPRPHAPQRTDFSRNIYTFVNPDSTDDERASMALALSATRTSSPSIELLVYLGLQARVQSRDDREIIARLGKLLATTEMPPARTSALCAWAREFAPLRCEDYVDLLLRGTQRPCSDEQDR